MWVRSRRLINYLILNGLFPKYEMQETAYFEKDYELDELMIKYTIKYECFPNSDMIPKRKLWRL